MITIKRNTKKFNAFAVKAEWTAGKILALRFALEAYAPHSPVAQDVLDEIISAIGKENDRDLRTEG